MKIIFTQINHQTKTEGDKNYLIRKCDRLDKEIDQLVYRLYGLTEEEINPSLPFPLEKGRVF